MISGLAYTSSLLFLAALCLGIGLGPLVNGRAIIFPLAVVASSLLVISLWFFVLMALSGPLDTFGLLSFEAWRRIVFQMLPIGALLLFVWSKLGERAKQRYDEMTKGYLVFGPPADAFREALRKTLADMNLQYVEMDTGFHLPELAAEMKVRSLTQPAGMHLFGFRSVSFNQVTKQIADGLGGSFSSLGGSVDRKACLRFAAVGLFFLLLGLTKG